MHPDAQSLLLNLCTLQLKGPHGWVDVTAPECTLLHAFAASTGQRLATSTMLGAVGKAADMLGKRALEVQIVRLRKKNQTSRRRGANHQIHSQSRVSVMHSLAHPRGHLTLPGNQLLVPVDPLQANPISSPSS